MTPERELERGPDQEFDSEEEPDPDQEPGSEQESAARKRQRVDTPTHEPETPVDTDADVPEIPAETPTSEAGMSVETPTDEAEVPTRMYPFEKLDIYLRDAGGRHMWCIDSSLVCKECRVLASYIEPQLASGLAEICGGLPVVQLPEVIYRDDDVIQSTVRDGVVTHHMERIPKLIQRKHIRALMNFLHLGTFNIEGAASFVAAVEMYTVGLELECESLMERACDEAFSLLEELDESYAKGDEVTEEESLARSMNVVSFTRALNIDDLWWPSYMALREVLAEGALAQTIRKVLLDSVVYRSWAVTAASRHYFSEELRTGGVRYILPNGGRE